MAILGTGTTVTFGTSGFSAAIMDANWSGITRGSVQTSHMGTTNDHTFIPTNLVDNGTVELTIQFNGSESPPIITNGATETVTIDWAGSGNTWAASCFQTDFSITATNEDLVTGDLTLKVTGAITLG
jgi:hypothetical protein